MRDENITEHRTYGATILERLDGSASKALRGYVKAFADTHRDYEAACVRADDARAKRDAALEAIAGSDATLDRSVENLANALVGAGASRKAPFADYSRHTPSELTGLAYKTEADEVEKLVKAVLAKKPAAGVAKAAETCRKNAAAVKKSLDALTKPQLAYAKALAERDALLPEWTKALGKLKKHAGAEWDEDDATFRSTFAPPDALQAPVKKKRTPKPAKPSPAPGTP